MEHVLDAWNANAVVIQQPQSDCKEMGLKMKLSLNGPKSADCCRYTTMAFKSG